MYTKTSKRHCFNAFQEPSLFVGIVWFFYRNYLFPTLLDHNDNKKMKTKRIELATWVLASVTEGGLTASEQAFLYLSIVPLTLKRSRNQYI